MATPTFFKAVRPNGKDFWSGTIDYAAKLGDKTPLKHPRAIRGATEAFNYISVSVESGDCTGFSWPARLFEVTTVGAAWTPHANEMPNKRGAVGVRVIRELPAHLLFGPQGEAIIEILEAFTKLADPQRRQMYGLRDDAWWSAWSVVFDGRAYRAGLWAARNALSDRLFGFSVARAAFGSALAVLLRHTIGEDGFTQAHYDALTKPWVTVTGRKAHPEDVMF